MAIKAPHDHIVITPGLAGGKPHIAGHRLTVHQIAVWHERLGRSADEIATDYDLSLADVYAALTHYFDHREDIDREIEEDRVFHEALKQRAPSTLREKMQEQRLGGQ